MTQEMLIMAAILVAVILLTFIGILSRYRKCKSDEVLVVYGKTGGEKKSAKLYHGGAAFVWPIIQGYEFLSMKPMQIDCKLTGALSAQNIRVDVPTTSKRQYRHGTPQIRFVSDEYQHQRYPRCCQLHRELG